MADDPFAEMMATWRRATDAYLDAWGKAFSAGMDSDAGATVVDEARKTYLGTQSTLAAARREAAEPLIEMAGGVPLSEFRRLADQIHTILLRLDRIDDQLAAIKTQLPPAPDA